ncbi:MAG: ATP-binding cassette domain-containing protein [Clostridia bacterium]|nr:ATP-binding cassette domain-containing protein [Clostridia bacterium]
MDNNDVLLKVENLCQYFKMGPTMELKAVDNVSFEVHKGEVFGLVGESGCGKTTTGRSIIKLYDITSGNVYFEGQRICAGIRSYKDAVRAAKAEYRQEAGEVKKLIKEDRKNGVTEVRAEYSERLKNAEEKLHAVMVEQTANIKSAKFDDKYCNKQYAETQMQKVRENFEPQLAALNPESAEYKELEKQFKEELRLAKKDRIMNKMQMIFQDPIASLDPRMTVRDIIAEGLIIRGVRNKKYIDEQVYKMLDLVGLVPEHANRYPHEFSGGQRQRIGIARAIILNPDLIIADEPISALDVSIQAQVINLLNDLRNSLGLTIMFIAHDLSVVKYFSDKIGVMYFGKMVELATSDELFAHPLHPYTKSLLSAIPVPDPDYEKNRKRIVYNPIAEHDYSVDKPVMRDIGNGHLIYCNEAEFERYKAEINS